MDYTSEPDTREKIFHSTVRENIIFLLLFILLYISSYAIVIRFKRCDQEEYYSGDDEDAKVYRISLWICTFCLAVSAGAALLLPLSILSNEIVILYPNSYYVQWLNSSLIQGLWNHIFLFSNLCLFILLPFAYLFSESEGFIGSSRGLLARMNETFVVLILLSALVLGMTYILSALIDQSSSSLESLVKVWNYYLPFLYSCVSFLGVLMLLLCTPIGFARLFTVVGKLIVKPQFLRNINEDFFIITLEENNLCRKLAAPGKPGVSYALCNGIPDMEFHMMQITTIKKDIERRRKASSLQRNIVYPVVMLLLLALTSVAVLMVIHNMLELLIGIKTLPFNPQAFSLGMVSLSALGSIGATLEIILIIYLMVTSVIGFYTVPIFSKCRPKLGATQMTVLLFNCMVLLILSCALPLLSRTLGITNFNLLGDFGRIEWLGNWYIVLFYNVVFTVATALSLATKFTTTIKKELYSCLNFLRVVQPCMEMNDSPLRSTSPTTSKKE